MESLNSSPSIESKINHSLPVNTQTAKYNEYTEPVIRVEHIGPIKPKPFYSFIKRTFDLIAGIAALIIAIIPMIIVAVAIKCDSKGPVIYKQERLGLGERPFMLYKFRSMRVDAEANGAQWAEKNDGRVTRVGRFIRASRLDELPQLINIISGQMSFVGPRPERACFYNEFDKYIDGFRQRMSVRPGLTGLAQVSGGYDLKPEEKIIYDIEYIKNRSVLMDLKCIFKTVAVVFNHNGAR
jgi:lipopolysaccharide/colanic/teichoic acid biosynthesis glycosyltransferase